MATQKHYTFHHGKHRPRNQARTGQTGTLGQLVRTQAVLRTLQRLLHFQAQEYRHRPAAAHLAHTQPQLLQGVRQRDSQATTTVTAALTAHGTPPPSPHTPEQTPPFVREAIAADKPHGPDHHTVTIIPYFRISRITIVMTHFQR